MAMTDKTEDAQPEERASALEEGPRSFTRFLEMLRNGDVADECSDSLHDLSQDLQSYAEDFNVTAKGEITLKLKIAADPSNLVTVHHEIIVKKPKRKPTQSNLWLTPSGNLSLTDPKQPSLPNVRVVAGGRAAAKSV